MGSDKHLFVQLMESEMCSALGCTEPIAVSYTAAMARNNAPGAIQKVVCRASVNIIKNATSVIIPCTEGRSGMKLACALGLVQPYPQRGLRILDGLPEEALEEALHLVSEDRIQVKLAETDCPLFIEVELWTEEHTARSITCGNHTNTILLEVDGEVLVNRPKEKVSKELDLNRELNLSSILEFAQTAHLEELDTIRESIETNCAISEEGLTNEYGLQVGKTIFASIERQILGNDIANYAMMLSSAGSDARMAGTSLPAYSNSGSGNQGIAATMPVVAAAHKLEASNEELIRACAVSNLVAIYIKSKLGRLTPVCGAIIAATGASCGICVLMGGGLFEMISAVKNMLGNVAGIFCDGAKASCALKVSTCVGAAVQAALLAMDNHSIRGTDGIVGDSVDETVNNFGRVLKEGMIDLDKILLDIIVCKE